MTWQEASHKSQYARAARVTWDKRLMIRFKDGHCIVQSYKAGVDYESIHDKIDGFMDWQPLEMLHGIKIKEDEEHIIQ